MALEEPWRDVTVRFLEGGRAQETPAAILWQDAWLPMRLVSEALVQGPAPGAKQERRFVLEDAQGRRWELSGQGQQWRARPKAQG